MSTFFKKLKVNIEEKKKPKTEKSMSINQEKKYEKENENETKSLLGKRAKSSNENGSSFSNIIVPEEKRKFLKISEQIIDHSQKVYSQQNKEAQNPGFQRIKPPGSKPIKLYLNLIKKFN